ncbi:MAG: family 1 glycosylhydrolase [Candidatus Portnoybacteria bacterium]|nr:family 1 glycosylhydrolase [Candidatus Portnoybacteria bacterium]
MLKFPKNFYWGTATSAYQVEGNIKNDWSQAGKKYDAGIACDHYNKYEQDFELAKQMNNNAHRFSIEWARIEPKPGEFSQKEIDHYKNVINSLKEKNIEPFVTLYHWTLPTWFSEKGHWLKKESIKYFERFAIKIMKEYKDTVKFWITINEPNIYSSHSFISGDWPPFERSFFKAQQVLENLAAAHKKIYKAGKEINKNNKIGIAKNNNHFKGIIKFFSGYYWNHQFLQKIKNHQDFIGLNYYFSSSLLNFLGNKKEVTDLNWEIYPKGIYHVLKDLKKYKKPIYITENGLADAKDKKRSSFITNHLKWTHKAIKDKIDVRGYFYWSLLDNFEWDKGFKPRFGLIQVDYKTLKRKPRPSSKLYAQICKGNALKTKQK